MILRVGLIAISALALSACDIVRVPGDGKQPPEPKPVIPEGAPGPPPPTIPVTDPWGEGEAEAPEEIPVTNTETPPDETPPTEDDAPISVPETETPPAETEPPVETPDAAPPLQPEPEPLPIKFQYYGPGDLIPGTGTGRVDDTIYAPDILFPIRSARATPQSQVYRPGGAIPGDQCDVSNYTIPWQDNFCEKRSTTRNTPLCPTNKVHQGQDIRVGTAADCEALRRQPKADRGLHEAIAVEDGIIQHIGTYSVQLKGTETGNLYSYLHLNMRRLRVSALDPVNAGDILGFVSNDFGSAPTTFHLHFEIKAPIEGEGIVHVPPYMSLVNAYTRRENGRGELVEDDTVAVASILAIPDDIDIIE